MIKNILRLILPRKTCRRLSYFLFPDEASLVYRILKHCPGCSKIMLDVGACHGSALERFAEDGWKVYAFEPDSENRKKLERRFGKFENVSIDPRAVSNRIESGVPFYRSKVSLGISGLSKFHPSHQDAGVVDTITLDSFCREHRIEVVDFLKVDTEGYDFFVLQSVPWDRIKPEIIVCEFEDRKTVPLGYGFHDLATYLLEQSYRVLVSEWYPIVKYGGAHRWRKLVSYPCELTNQQAWGNIIAVLNETHYSRLLKLSKRLRMQWKLGIICSPNGGRP